MQNSFVRGLAKYSKNDEVGGNYKNHSVNLV